MLENDLSFLMVRDIVAVNRIHLPKGKILLRRRREQCAIALKVEGKTVYKTQTSTSLSDKSHVCFLPAGADYVCECIEAGECLMIEFEAEGVEGCEPISFSVQNFKELCRLFYDMEHALTVRGSAMRQRCLSLAYAMLASLSEQQSTDYAMRTKLSMLAPALQYLEMHMTDPHLDTEALAAAAGISTVYFRKIFTAVYRVPPAKYVLSLRLDRAKGMLMGDTAGIGAVAEATGFLNIYHFSRVFRREVGMTPTEYMRTYRKNGDVLV